MIGGEQMSEQTRQKIVATAKNWVDEEVNSIETIDKLRANTYFIHQLQYYIGRLMFDSGEDYTTADESEIISAVFD